jgi:CBS domain-containing protein
MPSSTSIPPTAGGGAPAGHTDRRLETPVRQFMCPGVITVSEDTSLLQAERAMVRHGVHAILLLGRQNRRPLGWVTARGLLAWMTEELALIPASKGVTETPIYIDPAATAHEALRALSEPGVSHLLVSRLAGEPPQGVVSEMDLVALFAAESQ